MLYEPASAFSQKPEFLPPFLFVQKTICCIFSGQDFFSSADVREEELRLDE
jgi:hypothetical protein